MSNDVIRKLKNKIQRLTCNLDYRTNAYIGAYSTLGRMAEHIKQLPEGDPLRVMLDTWNDKDEALYHEWIEKSRIIKRNQRVGAKRLVKS